MDKTLTEMWDGLTELQRQVVANVLKGMSQRQAYMHAPLGKATEPGAVDACASSVLNNSKVKAYLLAVRGRDHDDTIMGRDEMLRRLTAISRTDIVDLVELDEIELPGPNGRTRRQTTWRFKESAKQDPLKMAAISELTIDKNGSPKVKLHSQLNALKQLAELEGMEMPKKLEHSGPGGAPITATVLVTTDPNEAAKAYADMIKGQGSGGV